MTDLDDGVQLEPGEKILRRAASSDRLIMKRFYWGTGLIASATIALQITGEGVGWGGAMTVIAVLAASMFLYSYFFERGARWILTDRRLIGPGTGSIPISPNLKIRVFLWGIAVRQSMLKTVNIRHIEDKAGFAGALRMAIIDSSTGNVPD